MRLNIKLLWIVIITVSAISWSEAKVKKIEMPDGSVLINPRVLGRTPEGLEIGHKNGIAYWKFEDLPLKIQKKYHYNPKDARAFRKKRNQARKRQRERERNKALAKKKSDKKWAKYEKERRLERIEEDILKTEKRISYLKVEIPKLEANVKTYMNNSVSLAGRNTGSSYNGWYGGFVRGGSNKAETTKRRVISGIAEEYSAEKNKLKRFRSELQKKELQIIKMRKLRDKLKARKKKRSAGD